MDKQEQREPITIMQSQKSSLGFALSLVVIGLLLAAFPWVWIACQTYAERGFFVAGWAIVVFGVMGAGLELDKRFNREVEL